MIAYIKGKLVHVEPTHAIVEAGGLGYEIKISLYTFSQIKTWDTVQLLTHWYVKDDTRALYGFATHEERHCFLDLLQVNSIGPRTAMTILSSLSPSELQQVITDHHMAALEAIKGIGAKAAQRIVLELRDKSSKAWPLHTSSQGLSSTEAISQEALEALIKLGISKGAAEKALHKVCSAHPTEASVEALIKHALRVS